MKSEEEKEKEISCIAISYKIRGFSGASTPEIEERKKMYEKNKKRG